MSGLRIQAPTHACPAMERMNRYVSVMLTSAMATAAASAIPSGTAVTPSPRLKCRACRTSSAAAPLITKFAIAKASSTRLALTPPKRLLSQLMVCTTRTQKTNPCHDSTRAVAKTKGESSDIEIPFLGSVLRSMRIELATTVAQIRASVTSTFPWFGTRAGASKPSHSAIAAKQTMPT